MLLDNSSLSDDSPNVTSLLCAESEVNVSLDGTHVQYTSQFSIKFFVQRQHPISRNPPPLHVDLLSMSNPIQKITRIRKHSSAHPLQVLQLDERNLPQEGNWSFSCGHTFWKRRWSLNEFSFAFHGTTLGPCKIFQQQCPDCLETARKIEKEKRKKREMELRHDQEALNTFKAQSENFKKQIEESTDNPELKKDLEELLKKCNEIWAERIMKIELEQESKPIFKPRLSSTFQHRLEDMQVKINLLFDVAEEKYCCEETDWNCWTDLKDKIGQIKEANIEKKFRALEKDFENLWYDANELMEEELSTPRASEGGCDSEEDGDRTGCD
jgi:hypothetical protein